MRTRQHLHLFASPKAMSYKTLSAIGRDIASYYEHRIGQGSHGCRLRTEDTATEKRTATGMPRASPFCHAGLRIPDPRSVAKIPGQLSSTGSTRFVCDMRKTRWQSQVLQIPWPTRAVHRRTVSESGP